MSLGKETLFVNRHPRQNLKKPLRSDDSPKNMASMHFNKLVRDRFPELLKAKGMIVETQTLDPASFLRALHKKLVEEASELDRAFTTDALKSELADVLEVIDTLRKTYGFSEEDLKRTQIKKRLERGGFEGKTFLTSAHDAGK